MYFIVNILLRFYKLQYDYCKNAQNILNVFLTLLRTVCLHLKNVLVRYSVLQGWSMNAKRIYGFLRCGHWMHFVWMKNYSAFSPHRFLFRWVCVWVWVLTMWLQFWTSHISNGKISYNCCFGVDDSTIITGCVMFITFLLQYPVTAHVLRNYNFILILHCQFIFGMWLDWVRDDIIQSLYSGILIDNWVIGREKGI